LYSTDNSPDQLSAAATWADASTAAATSLPDADVTAARYYIEHLGILGTATGAGNINVTNYGQSTGAGTMTAFRVVARGTGLSDSSQRIIISYYSKLL
jgi:type IV pilus assembly protein PilX